MGRYGNGLTMATIPEKPVPDEFGRVSVYAIGYYRRTDKGHRCMPTIHNLSWQKAAEMVEKMESDERNYWVSMFVDAF